MSEAQFAEALRPLGYDLTPFEVGRLFRKFDGDETGVLTLEEFRIAARRSALFATVVSTYSVGRSVRREPPVDYDYSLSTSEAHLHPAFRREPCASGRVAYNASLHGDVVDSVFGEIRRTLDYGYHVNYALSRQETQDALLQSVVGRGVVEPRAAPWIVYTCGAMGAGKGYVLRWMSRQGFFPLEEIVHVDHDAFRLALPEWKGYADRDAGTAGYRTQREAGYLAEIGTEAALRRGQHIWCDGTLQDHAWFSRVFDDIRARFPKYRIAIFHIVCPDAEEVQRRATRRGAESGRLVPAEVLLRSMETTKRSAEILAPKADFVATIENAATGPPRLISMTPVWSAIFQRFAAESLNPHCTAAPPPAGPDR